MRTELVTTLKRQATEILNQLREGSRANPHHAAWRSFSISRRCWNLRNLTASDGIARRHCSRRKSNRRRPVTHS